MGKTGSQETAAIGDASRADNSELLADMDVEVSVELGRRKLTLDQAIAMGDQSIMELDRAWNDLVDVRINGRLFARGEVVTVGESFGVRVLELTGSR